MKKLTAMLLALCMLLAVVPALGEDFTGTWYMTLAEVSMGSFVLNEDGTSTANVLGQDPYEGTWSADGDTVTITVDGAPAEFTFDGTNLVSTVIPVPLTREEGKLSMDIITKMYSNEEYELPEGMTELDVMTIAMNFMAEYSKLMEGSESETGAGTSDEPTEEPAPAEEAKITVLKENFYVLESAYSGPRAIYIAQVKNETSAPLYVRGGTMDVLNKEGASVGKTEYTYTCGSRYLDPGEISYVSFQADVTVAKDVTYEKTFDVSADPYYTADRAVTVGKPEFEENSYGSLYLKATVTNDSEEPLKGMEILFVLNDSEGTPLYLSTESIYNHELTAGSSITMVTSIYSNVQEYCEANGIEFGEAEAIAYTEVR